MKSPNTSSVTVPQGFLAAGGTCGIKASGKPDLALIVSDRPAAAAAVLTKNRLPGAPLIVTKRHLRSDGTRAIVCNSGVANDATGQQGIDNAKRTCQLVAQYVSATGQFDAFAARDVLPASTGVIGPQLPMDKIDRGVATVAAQLGRGRRADAAAARAIMTTDLVPKAAMRRVMLGSKRVTLGGIAKGSGMIAPNMATMLVFITTDCAIAAPLLRQALRSAVAESFNRISVDGHTSPSDMVIVLANGAAGNRTIAAAGKAFSAFSQALAELCKDLAYKIIADGEGATRVFRVIVRNARSQKDADRVGQAIVNSPLVKSAVHGGDPNWGRIVTAAANSGAAFTPARTSLHIGENRDVCVFRRGTPQAPGRTTLRKLHSLMKRKEVVFTLDLGLGKFGAEWLGCDLSRQYVAINADYTT